MKNISIIIILWFLFQTAFGQIPYRECTTCPTTENTASINTIYNYSSVYYYTPWEVTSDYGPRRVSIYDWHNGIDLRPYPGGSSDNHRGTGILSIEDGTIEHIKISGGGYKYIVVNGTEHYGYGHIFNSTELHLIDMPTITEGNFILKFAENPDQDESCIFIKNNQKAISYISGMTLLINNGAPFDGSYATGCGSTWKGIKVYGGNSDFDVKFTNGAIVENTSKAAVSMFAPEPWPDITQWGNGILQADNTTFNNTKRMVEFISWSPLPNPSYIVDCVQNGGKWGITNWNCQGILVQDNEFNDITEHCIGTETGSFTITRNEFNSGQNDILINHVSAGISTIVSSNVFNGSNTGYNARGTTFAQNEISNNNFQTGQLDVMNDGHNQYELSENNITATYGSASFDNGGGIGDVHNNEFTGNIAGTIPIGSNPDYNFYENCYNTTSIDNYIDGQVSPIIHSSGSAANNCFTHQGIASSSISDIDGNPNPFKYLEPADAIVNCKDAILAHTNVDRVPFGLDIVINCGSNITGGGPTGINYCFPRKWIQEDVWSAYLWLKSKLVEIENDPNLTIEQKEWFKTIYKRCFWRVRGYLFEIYIKKGEYTEARELYTDENHDDADVYIFS